MDAKIGRWVVAVLVLGIVANFLFGRTGVITVIRTKHETKILQEKVAREKVTRDSLLMVRSRLQSDPEYIERVVREELGYCLPGETVVKIVSEEIVE